MCIKGILHDVHRYTRRFLNSSWNIWFGVSQNKKNKTEKLKMNENGWIHRQKNNPVFCTHTQKRVVKCNFWETWLQNNTPTLTLCALVVQVWTAAVRQIHGNDKSRVMVYVFFSPSKYNNLNVKYRVFRCCPSHHTAQNHIQLVVFFVGFLLLLFFHILLFFSTSSLP